MNHNCSAVLAVDPRTINDSVYQKTLGINDFYLDDGRGGPPLGNIQLLGRVTAPILKSSIPASAGVGAFALSRRSVDWYAMSEDLPNPESRVTVRGGQIHLDWKRSNWIGPRGAGEGFQGATSRGRLSDRACRSRSIAARPRTSAAPSGSGATPRPRRWTRSAAPGTIPICSWSMPRFFRPRRRSIPR